MPQIFVGESPHRVSWGEYFAAIVPKGTMITWRMPNDLPKFLFDFTPKEGIGEVQFSWHYDGVVLNVKSGLKTYSLYFGGNWQPRIRRYRGPAILEFAI